MAEQVDVTTAIRLAEQTRKQVVVHGVLGHALDGSEMHGSVTVTPNDPVSTEVIIVNGVGETLG